MNHKTLIIVVNCINKKKGWGRKSWWNSMNKEPGTHFDPLQKAQEAEEHLSGVLNRIPDHLLFILETNGILLGSYPDYVRDPAGFENLHVRVSLKGASEEEFTALTGGTPSASNSICWTGTRHSLIFTGGQALNTRPAGSRNTWTKSGKQGLQPNLFY